MSYRARLVQRAEGFLPTPRSIKPPSSSTTGTSAIMTEALMKSIDSIAFLLKLKFTPAARTEVHDAAGMRTTLGKTGWLRPQVFSRFIMTNIATRFCTHGVGFPLS